MDSHPIFGFAEVPGKLLYAAKSRKAQLFINVTQKRFPERMIIRDKTSVIDIQLYPPRFSCECTALH